MGKEKETNWTWFQEKTHASTGHEAGVNIYAQSWGPLASP